MVAGRFIFGLGGECMSVAQSAIVTAWFKGGELSFAFGINLSVARVGSAINGPVTGALNTSDGVGFALLVGFFICVFSFCTALVLIAIDAYAAKKDGVTVALSEEDKFKCSDLKHFNSAPFWLVCASCIIIYMVIFPYIGNSDEMLVKRFGFPKKQADAFYATPYYISAVASPILGIIIDKVGRRTLFSKYPFSSPMLKKWPI